MRRLASGIIVLAVVFLPTQSLSAQLRDTKALTLAGAKRMADAAEARAQQDNWNVVIAIVDAGGRLLLLHRRDGAQLGSVDIALQKATTAVLFKRPTKALDDAVSDGRTALLAVDGILPLEGGLPITVDGEVIGGIGVSGAQSFQDAMVAQAGIDALMR
jgi:glc operon protein GlcG